MVLPKEVREKMKIAAGDNRSIEIMEKSEIIYCAMMIITEELAGMDGWLLVLDTQGINVWCAAGRGIFGTENLVRSGVGCATAVLNGRFSIGSSECSCSSDNKTQCC